MVSNSAVCQGVVPDKWELEGTGFDAVLPEVDRMLLDAVADTLIPPAGAFPAPSKVGVVTDFLSKYIYPDGVDPRLYPCLTISGLSAALDPLRGDFVELDPPARAATLAQLEVSDPDLFVMLRTLVYSGYYSRPEVILVIQKVLPAGATLRATPQPRGYLSHVLDWALSDLPTRGSYTKTADVQPVDVTADICRSAGTSRKAS